MKLKSIYTSKEVYLEYLVLLEYNYLFEFFQSKVKGKIENRPTYDTPPPRFINDEGQVCTK